MFRDTGPKTSRTSLGRRSFMAYPAFRQLLRYLVPSFPTLKVIFWCSLVWLFIVYWISTRPPPPPPKCPEPPWCASVAQIPPKAYSHGACIITRVKNAAEWLPEWIEYHKLMEIDRIFIFDDCSSDDGATEAMLRYYQRLGMIDAYFNPPMNPCDLRDRKPNEGVLLDFLFKTAKSEGCDWIGAIDIDEYINFIDEYDMKLGFKSYLLRSLLPYVRLTWYVVGGEGHVSKPPGLTIENYRHGQYDHWLSKVFVRAAMTNSWNISHFPWDTQPYYDCMRWDMHRMISWGEDLIIVTRDGISMQLPKNRIQLRHYIFRSLDEYTRSRGSRNVTSDNAHNPWFNNTAKWHESNNWKSWLPGQQHIDIMSKLVRGKLKSRADLPVVPNGPKL